MGGREETMTTKDGLKIHNAHPCGCYDVETETGGLLARICNDWVKALNGEAHSKCWSIDPHVCWRVEAH